ncbi:Xaa-Pro peptidase family protein [Desulfovibrio sp.]|uniref:M24 family metallopeptidase n=1 Tax=Desulfovibrio sp. TaxID=885 RepID=UPI002615FDB5|nr:Xaa-Pro peptidase family protein [Desulfovibrio sp.]
METLAGEERETGMTPEARAMYAARRDRLRGLMARRGLDALLVSRAPNRFYLSGFELHDPQCNESAGSLVITADSRDWLATDARYTDAAARLWDEDRIFRYGADAARDLAGLLRRSGARAGFEAKGVSFSFGRELMAHAGRFPALEAADGLVERLRRCKEPAEIAAMERSFSLNHRLMRHVEEGLARGQWRGREERELAWEIERFFRGNGAEGLAFASIVAAGANGALPHAIPGRTRIPAEGPVLVDVGCRVDSYCSDQTRTFWAGDKPSREFSRTLSLVREAQAAAMAVMKPGVALADVYAAALKVFKAAGVEKHFTHGLGHGVGLETHEAPSLSPRATGALLPGMTVTVEPGLYYPEWGGVRWEHTVLVTEDGIRPF